jgi:hypothetical protein
MMAHKAIAIQYCERTFSNFLAPADHLDTIQINFKKDFSIKARATFPLMV